LEALRPLGDLKLHTLAFLQTLKTTRLNSREVHKNIFASLPADKTVAFGVVKPLYRALFCHLVMLFLFDRFTLEGSRKSHGQVLLVGKKLLNNRFESNAKLEYQRVGARRERVFNSILWSVKVSEDAFPAAERTPSQTRAKMEKDRISCTRRAAGIPVGHQCDLFHGTVCLEEISQLGFHGCRHEHPSNAHSRWSRAIFRLSERRRRGLSRALRSA